MSYEKHDEQYEVGKEVEALERLLSDARDRAQRRVQTPADLSPLERMPPELLGAIIACITDFRPHERYHPWRRPNRVAAITTALKALASANKRLLKDCRPHLWKVSPMAFAAGSN